MRVYLLHLFQECTMQEPLPIAKAIREAFRHGYSFHSFKHDLIAGLVVSLIALPLAMALSIAVGLPPEHGLYTAIIAGMAAALLGGSVTQVSGPTAAFIVIVAPIVAEHGLRGLIIAEILAGILLLIFAFARLGRFIHFVPYPVTTGFTSGIAVVLMTLSMNDLFGLGIEKLNGSYVHKLGLIASHFPHAQWAEITVGLTSLAVILGCQRFFKKLPAAVIGVAVGTLLAYGLQHIFGLDIANLGNRFTYTINGQVGHGIPPFPPHLHWPTVGENSLFSWPSYAELKGLFPSALTIAALAALESLLSATVADSMSGHKHHPNSELFGIGVSNILSGLAVGIPATGAIARTATGISAGARTPVAAFLHGLFILFYVMAFARWISYVPMASLAALLVVTAIRMSHYKQFIHTLRVAPRSDSLVLLACFSLTVFIDMVAGVMVGIILAAFLFMQRISSLMQADVKTYGSTFVEEEMPVPEHTVLYHINGPLFFGTVEKVFGDYSFIHDHIKTLVIDMERVPLIDMTGLVAMQSLLTNVAHEKRQVALCGKEAVVAKILHKLPEDIKRNTHSFASVKLALNSLAG